MIEEILSREESRAGIESLANKGFIAEGKGIDFLLTPLGKTEVLKVWQKLEPDERVLLSISARYLKTTHYLPLQ